MCIRIRIRNYTNVAEYGIQFGSGSTTPVPKYLKRIVNTLEGQIGEPRLLVVFVKVKEGPGMPGCQGVIYTAIEDPLR